ncbi:hypothetical protein [Duganella sacchari]|nr:hypothetical protein [Duganella sacchari]
MATQITPGSATDQILAQLADTNQRLAVVEMDMAVIKSNHARREDIAKLQNTLLKWFVTTAITLAGLSGSQAFLAARFIH